MNMFDNYIVPVFLVVERSGFIIGWSPCLHLKGKMVLFDFFVRFRLVVFFFFA